MTATTDGNGEGDGARAASDGPDSAGELVGAAAGSGLERAATDDVDDDVLDRTAKTPTATSVITASAAEAQTSAGRPCGPGGGTSAADARCSPGIKKGERLEKVPVASGGVFRRPTSRGWRVVVVAVVVAESSRGRAGQGERACGWVDGRVDGPTSLGTWNSSVRDRPNITCAGNGRVSTAGDVDVLVRVALVLVLGGFERRVGRSTSVSSSGCGLTPTSCRAA